MRCDLNSRFLKILYLIEIEALGKFQWLLSAVKC